MDYYNVGSCAASTLHLVLRLRGGMFHETSGKLDHVSLSALSALVTIHDPSGAVLIETRVTGDVTVEELLKNAAAAADEDAELEDMGEEKLRELARRQALELRKKRARPSSGGASSPPRRAPGH